MTREYLEREFPVGSELEVVDKWVGVPIGTRCRVRAHEDFGGEWMLCVAWPAEYQGTLGDGWYTYHFKVVGNADHVGVTACDPRNNDGRSECFWCHVPTGKRGGGAYDVCPKCGR